jgi:hypothetical protein
MRIFPPAAKGQSHGAPILKKPEGKRSAWADNPADFVTFQLCWPQANMLN